MRPAPLHPAVWDLHAGDTGTFIVARILGVSTTQNLDAVTAVTGLVFPQGSPAAAVALTGSVESSSDQTIRLNMSPWLDGLTVATDDDPDEYHATIRLAAGVPDPWTWPERGYLLLRVWAEGVAA